MDRDDSPIDASRRDFLLAAGAGAAAVGLGIPPGSSAAVPVATGGYNILLILVDQERRFGPGELPMGFALPAHERLAKQGTTFVNHRINSCVCTPSRSVLYTGRHIQQTKMFDNTNFPWITSLDPALPTLGHMLRELGYYTAYKGKWHLTKEFETVNKLGMPTKIFTQEMEAYGFSDYMGVGDIIAHERGGYLHDGITAQMSVSWLRGKGRDLAAQGKPWFLAVNLVNPHDVMFYDPDPPGSPYRPRGLAHVARDPADPLYARQWDFNLPANHAQALDAPGRPSAHREYLRCHDAMVGEVPDQEAFWRRRHNYYLNCVRDVDRSMAMVLDELAASGLAGRTIVVFTSDHGDMDGAHKLHSKGALAYREQNNVPLVVAHPARAGGRECPAVTSHLDIVPTVLSMAGGPEDKRKALLAKLPGRDFSGVLADPQKASPTAVRDGMLFSYNMFAYLDGDFLAKGVAHLQKGGNPKELAASGARPDMRKRGALRSVYDGRYTFTRYFSPKQHNRPASLEQLYAVNDVELFDAKADPLEMVNLAADRAKNGELVMAMNEKLNRLVDAEVGEDNGRMLPGGADAGWEVTPESMAGF